MKYLMIIMLSFLTISLQAQEKKNKNAKYQVEVKGNCDMCKKRIEKAAYKVKGVKSADWNVGEKQLSLIIDERRTSMEEVENAIATTGHDTENAKATEDDYAKLHVCCKYERE